jgi:hypothetical protein
LGASPEPGTLNENLLSQHALQSRREILQHRELAHGHFVKCDRPQLWYVAKAVLNKKQSIPDNKGDGWEEYGC